MDEFGYKKAGTSGGGSHYNFIHRITGQVIIGMVRGHPGGIIKAGYIKRACEGIKENEAVLNSQNTKGEDDE